MSVTAYTAVKGDKRVVMRIYEFMLSLNLQMLDVLFYLANAYYRDEKYFKI